jgi:hypothetical protein
MPRPLTLGVILSAVVLASACGGAAASAPAQPSPTAAVPAASDAGGAGLPASSDGPPCAYLTVGDVGSVLTGSLRTATQVNVTPGNYDLCTWNADGFGVEAELLVAKNVQAFMITGDTTSLKNQPGVEPIPGLGDYGAFDAKQPTGAEIKFFKGANEVTLTLKKPATAQADFDALVVLAKKVAGEL